ncbi:hypothetical protein PHYBOEH_000912 [Phytophthora boehmeriae]|uniref:Ubiquitin-like domain-containing protein n=1 Tax=Phytophthora boehmeriae TaxID=109152 RepID=A0A8T1X0P5_9STRA|nr:hypothetical protein PHYBOEH_000912 [Phytophthora boehmeriae]
MGPYIRVKRRSQTVFLDVQLSDTFLSVKEKLGALFQMPPTSIQLWQGLNQKESKEFADAATLADHELQNDAVVYMCWKKENSDQWEELSVTKVEALDSENAAANAASGGKPEAVGDLGDARAELDSALCKTSTTPQSKCRGHDPQCSLVTNPTRQFGVAETGDWERCDSGHYVLVKVREARLSSVCSNTAVIAPKIALPDAAEVFLKLSS